MVGSYDDDTKIFLIGKMIEKMLSDFNRYEMPGEMEETLVSLRNELVDQDI